MSSTKDKIIHSLTVVAVFLVVVVFAGWFIKTLILKSQEIPTATLPPDTIPTTSITPIVAIRSLSLLGSSSYTPSQNVYTDSGTYDRESIQLALNGQFASARLVVEGAVKEEGPHFISLNFSTLSGVLNGVRNSENRLDIDQTDSRGGVFTQESGIKFIVDLLGQTALATSNKEFVETRQLTKLIRLWDYLRQPPPTIARVLIAPFDRNGVYGGAEISKIHLEYTCKAGSNCGAGLCRADELQLQNKCIGRLFGDAAEKAYRKSVGL